MTTKFVFDGESSASHGLIIGGGGTFNAPERDVTLIDVPGRNGSLTIDNGRFKNITVKYPFYILDGFAENMTSVRAWLLSKSGYRRLEDDYDPTHYRMARCNGPIDVTTSSLHMHGEGVIEFDCQPQRFLKSGDEPVETTDSGYILENPTRYDALPIITVEGTGDITMSIGSYTVGITGLQSKMVIDCETQNAYNGSENLNSKLSYVDFPKLAAGSNAIGWVGSVTKVTVVPKWWTV